MNIVLIGNMVHNKGKKFKACYIKTTKPCENASIQKQLHFRFYTSSPERKTTHDEGGGNNNNVGVYSLNFTLPGNVLL